MNKFKPVVPFKPAPAKVAGPTIVKPAAELGKGVVDIIELANTIEAVDETVEQNSNYRRRKNIVGGRGCLVAK